MDVAALLESRAPRAADRRPLLVPVTSVAAAVAMAISAAIAADGAAEHPALVALARSLMVGVPVAVGLYAYTREPHQRFGALLVAAGAGWFLTTLAESSDSLVYSVGRAAGWGVEVLLVYLFLAFPTGRLPARIDRIIVGAGALAVLATYLPRLLIAERYDVPAPFTSCVRDCPANAFFLLDREPAFVDAILRPLSVLLVVGVMIAIVLRLHHRLRVATPLGRWVLLPVLAVAMGRVLVMALALGYRRVDPSAPVVEIGVWLLAIAVPAVALAFLAGMVRWQLVAGQALGQLAACVRTMPDAATLRRAFADAFRDPTVEIAFPAPGPEERWMDWWGRPVALPAAFGDRCVSEVRDGRNVVAAIVHDSALCTYPDLLRAGTAMAAVALDNQRLAAEAEHAMREVRGSRARIAASAARERRRIERDLHDGAQQRLVALRIELELAEELVRRDPEQAAERLKELEGAVDEALAELRALAHGVFPPLLADRGLADAVRASAARCTVPVELDIRGVGRYAPEIESAVYFCVLEALQNVLKHAHGARRVVVVLDGSLPGELRFSVRDDGSGVRDGALHPGAGITNMRDRLAAFDGEADVVSTPRVGTLVRGRIPTPVPAAADA